MDKDELRMGLENVADFEASLDTDDQPTLHVEDSSPDQAASSRADADSQEPIESSRTAGGEAAAGKKEISSWIGKRLGHFRLMRMMGAGTMGVVFQGEDVNLQRIAAVKVLRRRVTDSDGVKLVDRFLLEARTAAGLDHPSIANVYEINQQKGWWYIAMEFLEGGSLYQLVRTTGPIPPGRAALMLTDAARGLAAAHEAGVIHRDIKPANLMLTRRGRCKLVDFGMVKLDSAENPFQDDDKHVIGTPYYLAPEIIRREGATPASDIYGLGATTYALLTGTPPYDGKKMGDIIKQHVDADVPDLCAALPTCPMPIGSLVSRAMSKNASDRPTADEFAAILQTEVSVALAMDPDMSIGGSSTSSVSLSGTGSTAPWGDRSSIPGGGSTLPSSLGLGGASISGTINMEPNQRANRFWIGALSAAAVVSFFAGTTWIVKTRNTPAPVESGSVPVVDLESTITNSIGMKLAAIPAGTFSMGSPPTETDRNNDERSVEVSLSNDFYMSMTEVTQRQWREVMGEDYLPAEGTHPNEENGLRFTGKTLPVYASWFEAAEFCRLLSILEDAHYRLPTEAEWEYAARADTTSAFHTGDEISQSQANIDSLASSNRYAQPRPMPVASFPPNPWGLYDMHGNVMEWCMDWKDEYPLGPLVDPTGPASGDQRVIRGGSWDSYAAVARSANRWSNYPVLRTDYLGFRVVMVPGESPPTLPPYVIDRTGPDQKSRDPAIETRGSVPTVSVDTALNDYEPETMVARRIRSVGSDTMDRLLVVWGNRFKGWHELAGLRHEGRGSGTAVPALLERLSHLGPMSRALNDNERRSFQAEFGYAPTQTRVAIDALAIYVHPDNPIVQRGMTLAELDAMFSMTRKRGHAASIDSWHDLGLEGEWAGAPVHVYSRNPASGTYGEFKKTILMGGDFKSSNNELVGSAEVVDAVANDRFGIGFSGIGYNRAAVATVPIAENREALAHPVAPDPAFASDGRYPLSRGLYLTINLEPGKTMSALQREFLRFVYSRQGQELVVQAGFCPLTAELAEQELTRLGLSH
ncbi:MAG: SUMF1/EgtB/PvdO family nonheme iron enzyme [Planctomycetota bacterium]|jgi:phosphate binding protein